MSDLISRATAIDAVKRLSLGETDATRLAMRIGDYLERMPPAQPEIVRCKDCRYRKFVDFGMGDCLHPSGCRGIAFDNHFCALGERREDQDE